MKIYKFLIILFFSFSLLSANVKLSISSNNIIKTEPFVFVIESFGSDIKFPTISEINGNIVQEISNSTSTNIINGHISKSIKKAYSFVPSESFVLPSFEVIVDGKSYKTNEQKITLQNAVKTKSEKFDLSIKSDSNEFYVGENFILTILFKYKKDSQLVDLSFEKPVFENFWYKQIEDTKKYDDGDFVVIELKFLMFALKDGKQKINPLKINAQVFNDSSYSVFSSSKEQTIYSNELDFDIKTLPQNIKLIGDFEIESFVDKQKVKKGEAVSYKLNIYGDGNIDDISDIKLPINDVTIYENKPQIKSGISNNKYTGTYEKVFSIIANKSFSIPSISLEYFDKELNKVVSKQSKSFDIEVLENEIKKDVILEKAEVKTKDDNSKETIQIVEKNSLLDRITFFILGVIVCLLIGGLYFYFINLQRKKIEQNRPLLNKVQSCKTKNELLKIMAIYLKVDSRLDELIFDLEKTKDINILKKEIIKILKELKL